MSIALLDVNVLIALFDPQHANHNDAQHWFGKNRKFGWATCPITINGCVRILSNPKYPLTDASTTELVNSLRELCSSPDHHFWTDSVAITDESLFRASMITGYKNITDVYLLGLALRNHGRLATFDRSIPLNAIHQASARNLVVLPET